MVSPVRLCSATSNINSIPPLLSRMAQETIKKRDRFTDYLSPEIWPLCRGGFHDSMIGDSNRAKEELLQSVDVSMIGGSRVLELTPKTYRDEESKVIIYIHGGALTLGAPDCQMQIPAPIAHRAQCKVIAVDYPLAPYSSSDDPHPAHTAVLKVYEQLLKTYNSSKISFLGDSAGGGIAFGVALMARDAGLPLPGVIIAYEPWVDMEQKGKAYSNHQRINQTVVLTPPSLRSARDAAFGDLASYSPYVSPINGEYENFSEVAVAVYAAGRDLLKDENEALVCKLSPHVKNVEYECWEGLWHGFQEHYGMPEAEDCADKAAKFLKANGF